ncbi:MAG: hypothetical protein LBT40_10310 [Deltaproteobacteria bacterium]|jgi:hypothetical protein|nr:hypothetical protein [Deltaproteobacteria bacterium]
MDIRNLLESLSFEDMGGGVFRKTYPVSGCDLRADLKACTLIYPESRGMAVNDRQVCSFRANENLTVFDCVHRLLTIGYMPSEIIL